MSCQTGRERSRSIDKTPRLPNIVEFWTQNYSNDAFEYVQNVCNQFRNKRNDVKSRRERRENNKFKHYLDSCQFHQWRHSHDNRPKSVGGSKTIVILYFSIISCWWIAVLFLSISHSDGNCFFFFKGGNINFDSNNYPVNASNVGK